MLPTHDDLQEVMQGSKRDLVRHQDVPPDRGSMRIRRISSW